MKRKSIICSLFTGTLLSFCLLTGCNNGQSNTTPTGETITQTETVAETVTDTSGETEETTSVAETISTEESTIETMSINIQIINMCGVEIGTFSVIDPATGEQINLDSIADEEMLSIDADWPVGTESFQWALYNQNGELCLEGSSNIAGVTSRAILILTGDGNVENVEVTVE